MSSASRLLSLSAALLVLGLAPAARAAPPCQPLDHSHAAFNTLLGRYVKEGSVDYAGLKAQGREALGAYLRSLEAVCAADYARFTREQRLAFWVNAYNAYTLELILRHYPLASIRKIGLLPNAAFREEFIPLRAVGEEEMSLNDIEHTQLRKRMGESRVHFALVCASRSCPELRGEAWRAEGIDAQLDEAARRFLADTTKNRYEPGTNTLYLSSIFKWFREDFEKQGSLQDYVARYLPPQAARQLKPGAEVKFLDYDWSLNGR